MGVMVVSEHSDNKFNVICPSEEKPDSDENPYQLNEYHQLDRSSSIGAELTLTEKEIPDLIMFSPEM